MKKIRLIELFAGIGAQAAALERLGVPFEHYRAIEFDKYAVASYNAIHGTNFEVSDIRDIHGDDLGIVNRNKYTYMLTYSFPCQDISRAGSLKGFKKKSGTRSGLLWEVERILLELNEMDCLPQILLMENVPAIHSKRNMKDFQSWIDSLEYLGYKSAYKDLNAKDYGIPQTRNRCFMVSILNGYRHFRFPKPIPLNCVMKDYLEDKVDEKYYMNTDKAKYLIDQLILNGSIPDTHPDKQTALLNFKYVKNGNTDEAMTITAREYKWFGTTYDCQNAVVEFKKECVDGDVLRPQINDCANTLLAGEKGIVNRFKSGNAVVEYGEIKCRKKKRSN